MQNLNNRIAIGALICVNAAVALKLRRCMRNFSGPSRQAIIGQRLSVILHCPAACSFDFPHPYLVADGADIAPAQRGFQPREFISLGRLPRAAPV
jgi:hypothetical protein